jgi:hypothetical protein
LLFTGVSFLILTGGIATDGFEHTVKIPDAPKSAGTTNTGDVTVLFFEELACFFKPKQVDEILEIHMNYSIGVTPSAVTVRK